MGFIPSNFGKMRPSTVGMSCDFLPRRRKSLVSSKVANIKRLIPTRDDACNTTWAMFSSMGDSNRSQYLVIKKACEQPSAAAMTPSMLFKSATLTVTFLSLVNRLVLRLTNTRTTATTFNPLLAKTRTMEEPSYVLALNTMTRGVLEPDEAPPVSPADVTVSSSRRRRIEGGLGRCSGHISRNLPEALACIPTFHSVVWAFTARGV
mmetsp:Transcript_28091/g.77260  ORF Transcript_28091/g.77260 Transcript_28091/m.77260 type:complete len:206 (+) Transcript_28091:250-867(+)